MAFINGESAFCRPPPAIILRGLWKCGIRGAVWRLIKGFLGHLIGRVKLGGNLYGRWHIRAGVPQGGALSIILFLATMIELEGELLAEGCGIQLGNITLALFGFVDDLVLLAKSAEELQKCIDVVVRWAQRTRLRINIGIEKSAVMVWGRGRQSERDTEAVHYAADILLPRVAHYKYLGLRLSAGGGWMQNIARMELKAVSKTSEIRTWSNVHKAPLDLATRLWALYVLRALTFGSAIMAQSECNTAALERLQRKVGRILLGHSSRSPTPCVLAELGWRSLASEVQIERVRLLKRVCMSTNSLTRTVAELTATMDDAWIRNAADIVHTWEAGGMPTTAREWAQTISKVSQGL